MNYEGQAAVELEMIAGENDGDHYPVKLEAEEGKIVISCKPLIRALIEDLKGGVGSGLISSKFHRWLVRSLADVARLLRQRYGIFGDEVGVRNQAGGGRS